MSAPTTLYRLFSQSDELLYIGIAGNPGRRFEQHAIEKPWWGHVVRVALQHFPTREAAAAAEVAAILSEGPLYNVVHNAAGKRRGTSSAGPIRHGLWVFEVRRSGRLRESTLQLYPELDGSSVVDACDSDDGHEQLEFYVDHLRRTRRDEWERDAIPIYWTVVPVHETAPFQAGWDEDFLSFFTWPVDSVTRRPVDWYQLPVVNDRFPEFAAALGWKPSPLQPTCPLRSIWRGRRPY